MRSNTLVRYRGLKNGKFGSFDANIEFCSTNAKFRSDKIKAPKVLHIKAFGV